MTSSLRRWFSVSNFCIWSFIWSIPLAWSWAHASSRAMDSWAFSHLRWASSEMTLTLASYLLSVEMFELALSSPLKDILRARCFLYSRHCYLSILFIIVRHFTFLRGGMIIVGDKSEEMSIEWNPIEVCPPRHRLLRLVFCPQWTVLLRMIWSRLCMR